MQDLKSKTIRGGAVRVIALAANSLFRIVSMMILSRLLEPRDFGLVGMAAAFTGVLFLFRDFGLSTATVQRATVSEEQTSTLFWLNFLFGAVLSAVTIVAAPAVASFYHEPRLLWITRIVALGFLFNGAGIQHSAILQRNMGFTALALTDMVALVASTSIGIVGAIAGYGYWALAAMTASLPLFGTIGLWIATRWVPGLPRRGMDVLPMLRFGSTVTLNSLVLYMAFNMDKVLLGRFWGSEVIGIYSRAYQVIRIPTDTLNSTVGEVAFSALSRVQDAADRFRRYFLRGYSLVLSLTFPITVACGIFPEEIVAVLLGPKWSAAAQTFRLLAPTILVFAIANPLGWLLTSLGMVGRGLKIACVLAPIMFAGYMLGLSHGANGVALAYSATMLAWLVPMLAWAVHGTPVSLRDVVGVVSKPFASAAVATAVALPARPLLAVLPVFPQLVVECLILFGVYFGVLLFVAGQKSLFLDLIRGWRGDPPAETKGLVVPV
jgi:O-antigen/teichoic acid export membrane protein